MGCIPREVIWCEAFEAGLRILEPNAQRADEFVRGAEWTLCREPTVGHQVAPESHVWMLSMADPPGHPCVVLYYTFNDEFLWFLSVQLVALPRDALRRRHN